MEMNSAQCNHCRPAVARHIFIAILFGLSALVIRPQSIQPVITEYGEKADGKFEVTNDTLTPVAIVIEPKSFSIDEDGRGHYRALDPDIHIKLSTTSFRLEPKQTYLVFYKATADTLPAWFTIYAVFSPIHAGTGVSLRVMLPHTAYLFQKKPINKEMIQVGQISYVPGEQEGEGTLSCDIENTGKALVRVQEVRAVAGRTSVVAAGFPLLPKSSRHLSVDWKDKNRPVYLLFHFPHFDVKEPVFPSER